jgi:magnesium transporter
MITVYSGIDGSLRKSEFPADGKLPPGVVWVDCLNPSIEEQKAVNEALKIDPPSREEMGEIEFSSRIYREGEASYMTVPVLYRAETLTPETTPITFIRTATTLVSVRFGEPQAITGFIARAQRPNDFSASADTVFIGLMDALIDRAADVIERIALDQDNLSKTIFHSRAQHERAAEEILQDTVLRLGRIEDINSRLQDSLLAMGRLLSFLGQTLTDQKAPREVRERIKTLARDVRSISEHSGFTAQKGGFLLEATLGLIGVRHTEVIKIFSLLATVLLPPTLIASVYGMNFVLMPELNWALGYPFALLLIALSAILPYWFFKRRGWF